MCNLLLEGVCSKWVLIALTHVIKRPILMTRSRHITYRGGWWLKWKLTLSRWRIWPYFVERNTLAEKFSKSGCVSTTLYAKCAIHRGKLRAKGPLNKLLQNKGIGRHCWLGVSPYANQDFWYQIQFNSCAKHCGRGRTKKCHCPGCDALKKGSLRASKWSLFW